MQSSCFKTIILAGLAATLNLCFAANFGTVVPLHGTVSDIALDESRSRLYAANFTAYRVEVINTSTRRLVASIPTQNPPSAVAVSPDGHYLVIGEYQTPVCQPGQILLNPIFDLLGDHINPSACTFLANTGAITVYDLQASSQLSRTVLTGPALTVTFGADNNALVLLGAVSSTSGGTTPGTQSNLFLLNPGAGTLQPVSITVDADSTGLPVPLVTFPAEITKAAAGVSRDGNAIFVMAQISASTTIILYDVASQTAKVSGIVSTPPLGPASVTVDRTGSNVLLGWSLWHQVPNGKYHHWAEFPDVDGKLNLGSHAWDVSRNTIYAQIPATGDKSVLHVMDTDNLTVRERIQLPEYLAGKSILSSDSSVMYSGSISGVTILPISQLPQTQRLGTLQEDLLFTSDLCANLGVQRTLSIRSLGSVPTDFTLSLPDGVTGVSLSKQSGTTPADIVITIDPAAFNDRKGTTSIPLTITSKGAVNLPLDVPLLVNTRDFNQRGQIVNIPGKLVDMMADPVRNRLYVVRQDKNVVLVYDTTTSVPGLMGTLRTGNTPMKTAITTDRKYLIVGNDHSQIASVFDLDTLQSSDPILFFGDRIEADEYHAYGHYPRTIGVTNSAMFATVRPAGGGNVLDQIDFERRIAFPQTEPIDGPPNPSVYKNALPSDEGALAATQDSNYLLLTFPDGTVAEYDSYANTWVASRRDVGAIDGAYAAMNIAANQFAAFPDGVAFLAGPNLLNAALVPVGDPFADNGAHTSGVAVNDGSWIRSTTTGAADPGVIQRIDFVNFTAYNATPIAESPVTADSLATPPVGQIGQSILPFTRSLSTSNGRIFALTISGLTILPPNFDAALAKPVITSVVNSADGTTALAVGGDINIKGANLAPAPVSAGKPPLSTSLGNVCAVLGDTPLALFSVSSPLLVAQLPFSTGGTSSLVVHTPGGISDPFPVTVAPQAPAIFSAIRNDNGEPLNFTNPIHPSSEITIYLTGLGLTSPLPALGDVPPSGQAANVIGPVTVTLGSAQMFVSSVTLTPDQVGVYQIRATAPGWVSAGRSVPLTVRAGSVTATYSVRVVNP